MIHHKESGFDFNKKIVINNTDLDLIQLGTRYKFFLFIYGIGFYDSNKIKYNNINKNNFYNKVFDNESIKCLSLIFYRSANLNKIISSFIEEISIRTNSLNYYKNEINELKEIILNNIKQINYKDNLYLLLNKNKLCIYLNNKFVGEIISRHFAKMVFECYLDEKSVSKDLRENILTKSNKFT